MSDRYQRALRYGGTVIQELEFFQRDQSIARLRGLVLDGTVTAERQMIRRHMDLTIIDREHTLTPADADDLFGAWGRYEVMPKRGIRFPDGTEELTPLGLFRIEEIDGQWPRLTVRAFDRMYQISKNEFTVPYNVRVGTNTATAILDLAQDRWGRDLDANFVSSEDTTPTLLFEEGSDPSVALGTLATSGGFQVYFDQVGTIRLSPEPDLFGAVVAWRFVEGERGSTMLSGLARRTITEGAYNGVVATGEANDLAAPVRGEWWDENPGSPTYIHTFGRRPRRYSSPLLTTDAQCASAARKIGLAGLGLTDAIQFPSLVIPGLDVGDVIYAERPAQYVAEHHILDQLTFQMRAQGTMDTQTRAAQVEELAA
jgi:hypothetical protein